MFFNMFILDEGNYNVLWIFNVILDMLEFLV